MGRPGGAPENLVKRKKGDPALPGGGHPKGKKNTATILRELLSALPEAQGEPMRPLAHKLLLMALKDGTKEETKLRAIDMIIERVDGKVSQQINVQPVIPSEEKQELERIKAQYDDLYTEDGKLMFTEDGKLMFIEDRKLMLRNKNNE